MSDVPKVKVPVLDAFVVAMPPSSTIVEFGFALPDRVSLPPEADAVVTVMSALAEPLKRTPADKAVVVMRNDLAEKPSKNRTGHPQIETITSELGNNSQTPTLTRVQLLIYDSIHIFIPTLLSRSGFNVQLHGT